MYKTRYVPDAHDTPHLLGPHDFRPVLVRPRPIASIPHQAQNIQLHAIST